MRSFVGIIIIILFVACTRNKSVQVSGRVETGDTVVYFQVNDSLHKFRLDEKHYFSGKIELEKGTTTAKIKITAMLDGYKPSAGVFFSWSYRA